MKLTLCRLAVSSSSGDVALFMNCATTFFLHRSQPNANKTSLLPELISFGIRAKSAQWKPFLLISCFTNTQRSSVTHQEYLSLSCIIPNRWQYASISGFTDNQQVKNYHVNSSILDFRSTLVYYCFSVGYKSCTIIELSSDSSDFFRMSLWCNEDVVLQSRALRRSSN